MTKIEWAHAGLGRGETWNPIRASNDVMGDPTRIGWHCEKVSPACTNCYAERQNLAGARGGTKLPYKPGHRANGDIRVYLDEKTLLAPLAWKQPRGVFVCSMTDVFGDWVDDAWLDKIFAVAALCPQHRFVFLTKRPKRMREYMTHWPDGAARVHHVFSSAHRLLRCGRREWTSKDPEFTQARVAVDAWPLSNVWLGVTAEDQQRADERRDDLMALAGQGWTTLVSYEPALGPVDWTRWGFVDQIIFGGETGPKARPAHPQWARDTRDFCAARGIAFFFKQWGEYVPCRAPILEWSETDGLKDVDIVVMPDQPTTAMSNAHDEDIRRALVARGAQAMARVGKSRAGRLLDGREWNQFPETMR